MANKIPTALYVVGGDETNHNEYRNACFELKLRYHQLNLPLPPTIKNWDVVSFSQALNVNIPDRAHDIMILLPKLYFTECMNDCLKLLTSSNVFIIGERTFKLLESQTLNYPDASPLIKLSSLSKKNHPRYSLCLENYSFIVDDKLTDIGQERYTRLINRIRWLGGLIREKISPSRKNQFLLAGGPKGRNYKQAVTLDIPILKYDFIDAVWTASSKPEFQMANLEFISTYHVRPFLSSVLYFHGFPEKEIETLHNRTDFYDGIVAESLEEPGITHVIVDKQNLSAADFRDFLSVCQQKWSSSNGLTPPWIVSGQWFWESVKAEARADENISCIDVPTILAKSFDSLEDCTPGSPVHSKNDLRSDSKYVRSREQLLAQFLSENSTRDDEKESDLVLPGYSNRKDRGRVSEAPSLDQTGCLLDRDRKSVV